MGFLRKLQERGEEKRAQQAREGRSEPSPSGNDDTTLSRERSTLSKSAELDRSTPSGYFRFNLRKMRRCSPPFQACH